MKDQIKKAIEVYNKYAKIYADRTFNVILQFQQTEFISLLPGKKVLDIGSGSGRDAKHFKEEGLDITGIDISDGLLDEAKKRAPGVNFQKMDMLNMTFKENSFDGIWIAATLSDIEKKDAKKFLEDCKKILKDKGVIYISVKEGEGEKVEKKSYLNNEERFYSYYTKQELMDLLESVGFKIVKSRKIEDPDNNWIEVFAKKPISS